MRKIKYLLLAIAFCVIKTGSAATHNVNVEDYEFGPEDMIVNVGDVIIWTWDHGFHTTTSTVIPSNAAAWNNPIDQNNTTFTYTVTAPGSYDYECIYHASMGMTGHFTAVGTTGIATFTLSKTKIQSTVMHENLNVLFGETGKWNVDLRNLTGASVFSETYVSSAGNSEQFSVANLPEGIYIVTIGNGKESISQRVVKE